MKASPIADFFDSLAPFWDEGTAMPPSWLLDKIGIQEGDSVLDVGCGSGIITGSLAEYSHSLVLGVDISPKMIEKAKVNHANNPNVSFLNADFCQYGFDSAFDIIVIYNAFPHFLDKAALKDALVRGLKPNGKAAILHSLSREQLKNHHSGLSSKISRELDDPRTEASFFEPELFILEAEESSRHYLILLQKR